MDAYKICKQRIDDVEKALEQALGNAQIESDVDGGDQPQVGGSGSGPKGGPADPDADIPF